MTEQNDGTQEEQKGVRMPPQGSTEGSAPPNGGPVDRWIKRKAEQDAKRPNPLLKGGA
jgi:hypothetical protein